MTSSFAIVPAAGLSRRMGRPKLLVPWRGRPLIRHVLDRWTASRVDRVVVVVRSGDEPLAAACREGGAEVVEAGNPPEMKDSVRAGLEAVRRRFDPGPQDVWLLAPADLPRLSPRLIDRMLQLYDPASPAIWAPEHDGRRGHPVLFPWPLAGQVARLGAGEGVNRLLDRFPVRRMCWTSSDAWRDVDTPEDYQRLLGEP